LNLESAVPTAQEEYTPRVEAGFKHAQYDSTAKQLLPSPNEPHPHAHRAPRHHQTRQPQRRAQSSDGDVGRELKDDVGNEEHHRHERVPVADRELQVDVHAGDARIGQVDAVDERKGVDAGEDGQETDVDLAEDAAGFFGFAFGWESWGVVDSFCVFGVGEGGGDVDAVVCVAIFRV